MAKHRNSNDIDSTAAAWAARSDRGPLSAREQSELDAWLARDPRHAGAFARAQAVLKYFERAGSLGGQYDPRHFVGHPRNGPSDSQRRRFLWLAGAGIAAGITGAAILWQGERRVSTRLGEILRVPLQDGSAVTLNSASAISIRYDRTLRLVRLLNGEALFDVAKDAVRPFVVKAAQASVVAVGSSVTVEHAIDSSVKVMVREGTVDFRVPRVSPRRLFADMLATLQPDARIEVEPLPPMEVNRRLAWRDGMISFDGDTLAQAALEFAHYSNVRIVIDDPVVAGRRIVGLYSATDPVGFAKAVALSMDLSVEHQGNMVRLGPGTAK